MSVVGFEVKVEVKVENLGGGEPPVSQASGILAGK